MIYQSFSKESVTEKKSRKDIRITLYSSEGRSELENYIRQYYPPGYGALEGEGYVETVTFRQEGPIWYADVSIWHDTGLGITIGQRTPLNHSLRAVAVSLPPQQKSNYRTKWDHFFWQRCPVVTETAVSGTTVSGSTSSSSGSSGTVVLPTQYASAVTEVPFEANGVNYRWTKNGDDLDGTPKNGYYWKCIATPTKPGVESWDFHTYQITEYGEYHDERTASWVVDSLLDHIRSQPLLGDFGLSSKLSGTGWNWKCDDAHVSHDGKRWVATLVWTLSGDRNGWDTDLYSNASS